MKETVTADPVVECRIDLENVLDALPSKTVVQRLREGAALWTPEIADDAVLMREAAAEIERQAQEIERLQNDMARAYMRLQCADVPRNPWHWEVCKILGVETKP